MANVKEEKVTFIDPCSGVEKDTMDFHLSNAKVMAADDIHLAIGSNICVIYNYRTKTLVGDISILSNLRYYYCNLNTLLDS